MKDDIVLAQLITVRRFKTSRLDSAMAPSLSTITTFVPSTETRSLTSFLL